MAEPDGLMSKRDTNRTGLPYGKRMEINHTLAVTVGGFVAYGL